MSHCTCHSYNWDEGEIPNVVMTVPDHIRQHTDGRETVCIDACISDAISSLWERELPTLNSCCGHNRQEPSVIIPDGADPEQYLAALAEVDARAWVVSRWERVEYRRTT